MRKINTVIVILCISIFAVVGVWLTRDNKINKSDVFVVPKNPTPTLSPFPDSTHSAIIEQSCFYDRWFTDDLKSEKELMTQLRQSLSTGESIQTIPPLNIDLRQDYAWIAMSLFEEGQESIRWITHQNSPRRSFNRAVEKLRSHSRFGNFHIEDSKRCRILFEVITGEYPINLSDLQTNTFDSNRFEPGITGIKLDDNGRDHYYMPTEAVVKSHLSLRHVFNEMAKKVGIAKKTNKISERIKLLLELPAKASLITSMAFVTDGDDVLPLYRGYPVPVEYDSQLIDLMVRQCGDWLLYNMYPNGQFLYYYDAATDSVIDHQHPSRTVENNYYNILRHCGGVVMLLRMYEYTDDKQYLSAAQKALDFLVQYLRPQMWQDRQAYYVFYNEKAKLGGSGIALISMMRYFQMTQDPRYLEYAHGLANHIMSRTMDDGEMIGYYIHPLHNQAQPILNPLQEQRKQLFSFYYPGEALMGLALYYKLMPPDAARQQQVLAYSRKAMDFLIFQRPEKYSDLFEPLPSDGWLMQAIEEWADVDGFCKPEYIDFVFEDARQMIDHMYKPEDKVYYDYPGTFYYQFGDHGYIDGARAEGLIAAYYLAGKLGMDKEAQRLLSACKMAARSLMYSYNSSASSYPHLYPQKSQGSFRFKFTRQWVRVDTAQHGGCFFVRLLQTQQRPKD